MTKVYILIIVQLAYTIDVNKDLGLKAKTKDLGPKAKDLSAKAKDLGPKTKDSRCQGQIFQRSFYIVF